MLPWIFPAAPLKVNGAPGNIMGNLTALITIFNTTCIQFCFTWATYTQGYQLIWNFVSVICEKENCNNWTWNMQQTLDQHYHAKVPTHALFPCIARGPFHERFFHCNSNSMQISFCSHPSFNKVIGMKFCTWHDSCAVMVCAKICSKILSHIKIELHQSQFSIEFELWWKNRSWNRPLIIIEHNID